MIVHVETEEQTRVVGLVVDMVSDVHHLGKDAIQDDTDLTSGAQGNYIRGLGQIDDKMVILINLDKPRPPATSFLGTKE